MQRNVSEKRLAVTFERGDIDYLCPHTMVQTCLREDWMMRIVVFQRRWITALGCAVAAAAMFGVVTNPAAIGAAATQRELPIYAVEEDPKEKRAALTFDAAWGNEDTETLIRILKRYQVPATFFLVGQWVDRYPESVRALSDAGHEIGNHSDTHPYLTRCDGERILAELERCNEKIRAITGREPKLHRCPFGDYDDNVIRSIRSIGMEPIQWNVDSLDWKEIPAGEISRRVLSQVKGGSIILFHNAAAHTPEALPEIIETLQREGYTLCTVSELLVPGEYTLDSAGVQHPVSGKAR